MAVCDCCTVDFIKPIGEVLVYKSKRFLRDINHDSSSGMCLPTVGIFDDRDFQGQGF